MATYVLVHGGSHGGWCWRDVGTILRNNGHNVFTPTLTGLGERSHLLSPDIDLNTHILDIANVLEWEELDDVILVGHSYSGHVITGVADRVKYRLRHVVYLDAFIPKNGQSPVSHTLTTLNPHVTPEEVDAEIERRKASANKLGGAPTFSKNMFDIPKNKSELYDWVERRITLHPVNSHIHPIRLENDGSEGLPRTYILCTGSPQQTPFKVLAQSIRSTEDWSYRELDTGHDAMVTMPTETATLLLEIADS